MVTDTTQAPPVDTGNPGLNSIVRSVIIGASMFLTGAIMGRITPWLDAHGWTQGIVIGPYHIDPTVAIFGVVFGVVAAIAAGVWGYVRGTTVGKWLANVQLAGVQAGIAAQASVTATAPLAPASAITHADAAVIVQKFAPGTTADDLNAKELQRVKP